MDEAVIYPGRDLEAMSFAENYHRWILDVFRPYLGKRVVEVGAGSGSFSELILGEQIESLSLVEPSEAMYQLLTEQIDLLHARSHTTTYNAVFRRVAARIKEAQRPDSIIYVNVLEHIADDEGELEAAHDTLAEAGRLLIFVPALRWLYGSFDEQIGHVRRYTKRGLEDKCERAGFKVVASRYFDCVGVVPWWVKYRVLRSGALEPRAVAFYDKCVIPLARVAEGLIKPPIGKNVILIAEKITKGATVWS